METYGVRKVQSYERRGAFVRIILFKKSTITDKTLRRPNVFFHFPFKANDLRRMPEVMLSAGEMITKSRGGVALKAPHW